MNRHRLRVVALAMCMAVLAACAGQQPSDLSEASAEVTLMLFGDGEEVRGYESMIDAFTQDNPDVDVTLSPVATQDELMARLTTSIAGGSPPDVFLLNFRRYGQFAAQGAIEPVQPHLDDSQVLDEADFHDAPFDAFRFDGENLTCFPQNLSSLVVYWNVDLFERLGIATPTAGWTWDDFLATAQQATTQDTWGLGVPPKIIRLAPFVWSNGGAVVDDPDDPTTFTLLSDPAARQALDWFLDLQLEHGVVPPDAEELSEDSEARFLRGGLGMYMSSRVAVPTLRTIDDFEWDVAPLPVAPGGEPASILHSDAYCMSADSDDHAAAWRLIEFAMDTHGQQLLAASGRTVPSRIDVGNSEVFLESDQPPASSQVYLDAEPHMRATPTTGTWIQVEGLADDLLEEVFYGRVEREEGLQRLVDETAPLFVAPTDGQTG